jgi:hypothetical protein
LPKINKIFEEHSLLGCKAVWPRERVRNFRGTYCLHLQVQRVSQARNKLKQAASSASAGFLLGSLFDPEDGGNMFI